MTAQLAAHGRLVADPTTRTSATGKEWTSARLAVNVSDGEAEATLWLTVVAFGRQSAILGRHRKGEMLSVSGRFTNRPWTDKEGNQRDGWTLVADAIISARTVRPGGGRPAHAKQERKPDADFEDDLTF